MTQRGAQLIASLALLGFVVVLTVLIYQKASTCPLTGPLIFNDPANEWQVVKTVVNETVVIYTITARILLKPSN